MKLWRYAILLTALLCSTSPQVNAQSANSPWGTAPSASSPWGNEDNQPSPYKGSTRSQDRQTIDALQQQEETDRAQQAAEAERERQAAEAERRRQADEADREAEEADRAAPSTNDAGSSSTLTILKGVLQGLQQSQPGNKSGVGQSSQGANDQQLAQRISGICSAQCSAPASACASNANGRGNQVDCYRAASCKCSCFLANDTRPSTPAIEQTHAEWRQCVAQNSASANSLNSNAPHYQP